MIKWLAKGEKRFDYWSPQQGDIRCDHQARFILVDLFNPPLRSQDTAGHPGVKE